MSCMSVSHRMKSRKKEKQVMEEEAPVQLMDQKKNKKEKRKRGIVTHKIKSTSSAFFACYLLCSLNPSFPTSTYIGFAVDPCRRLRQHNDEIRHGASRTRKKQPWEMILCVYGFPSKVSALKFEWAWQHPKRSVALKKVSACMKPSRGIGRKIKLVYTMLTLTEWRSLNLTVNFLSTKHIKHTKGCPTLPSHMKVQIGSFDEFPCYRDAELPDNDDISREEPCSKKFTKDVPEQISE